jgi:hypothetical protein
MLLSATFAPIIRKRAVQGVPADFVVSPRPDVNLHVVTIKEEPLTPLHGGHVSLLANSRANPLQCYLILEDGCCRDMANQRSRHQHVVPNLNEFGPKTLIAEMPMSGDGYP